MNVNIIVFTWTISSEQMGILLFPTKDSKLRIVYIAKMAYFLLSIHYIDAQFQVHLSHLLKKIYNKQSNGTQALLLLVNGI